MNAVAIRIGPCDASEKTESFYRELLSVHTGRRRRKDVSRKRGMGPTGVDVVNGLIGDDPTRVDQRVHPR